MRWQNDPQVSSATRSNTGVWTAQAAIEQAGCLQMKAEVWNARVLLRELREPGYTVGYTILTDWLTAAGIGASGGGPPLRNTHRSSSAGGLGAPGHDYDGR